MEAILWVLQRSEILDSICPFLFFKLSRRKEISRNEEDEDDSGSGFGSDKWFWFVYLKVFFGLNGWDLLRTGW